MSETTSSLPAPTLSDIVTQRLQDDWDNYGRTAGLGILGATALSGLLTATRPRHPGETRRRRTDRILRNMLRTGLATTGGVAAIAGGRAINEMLKHDGEVLAHIPIDPTDPNSPTRVGLFSDQEAIDDARGEGFLNNIYYRNLGIPAISGIATAQAGPAYTWLQNRPRQQILLDDARKAQNAFLGAHDAGIPSNIKDIRTRLNGTAPLPRTLSHLTPRLRDIDDSLNDLLTALDQRSGKVTSLTDKVQPAIRRNAVGTISQPRTARFELLARTTSNLQAEISSALNEIDKALPNAHGPLKDSLNIKRTQLLNAKKLLDDASIKSMTQPRLTASHLRRAQTIDHPSVMRKALTSSSGKARLGRGVTGAVGAGLLQHFLRNNTGQTMQSAH